MTEMPAAADDERLVPYLLGTLPDEQRQQIDNRLLSDEPLFESLRAAENELVYDYAVSLLNADERARFEARFPANTAIRRKVANARALLSRARDADRRSPSRTVPRWLVWVPLAAATVAILVVGWLVRENALLRDRLAFSNRVTRAAVERAAETERAAQSAQPPAGSSALPAPSASPATGAASPIVFSMVLQPGVVRADARARRVRIAPGTTSVRLQLDLPSDARSYTSYRAFLRTPDDVEVWSGVVTEREGNLLVALVPAAAVKPNDYELVLSGAAASGSLDEIANYSFSVVR